MDQNIKGTAVMYGAGSIGRGFIGQLFALSGYRVVFIDVNAAVVDKLNREGSYVLELVTASGVEKSTIAPVSAVNGMDAAAAARAIAEADVMATAVGVNILPRIKGVLAEGIKLRCQEQKPPLNIIICENLIAVDTYMKELLEPLLDGAELAYFRQNIGLLEASVGRMVPLLDKAEAEADPTRVVAEPFDKLPVKSDDIKGTLPQITGVIPFSPFEFYIERKLFVHNMSHAVCAYLGAAKGYEYIYQAVEDPEIRPVVAGAMGEIARALSAKYSLPLAELTEFTDDLLIRFANPRLRDTTARVGRDVIRKLKRNDRLIGAALCCLENGVEPQNIVKGIFAALSYQCDEDETTAAVAKKLAEAGLEGVLKELCGLTENEDLYIILKEKSNG